jgi:hypothetical protein
MNKKRKRKQKNDNNIEDVNDFPNGRHKDKRSKDKELQFGIILEHEPNEYQQVNDTHTNSHAKDDKILQCIQRILLDTDIASSANVHHVAIEWSSCRSKGNFTPHFILNEISLQ